MKYVIIIISCFLISSCTTNSQNENVDIEIQNELIVGIFALERFDETNKRILESIQVNKGTWSTYKEGDNFEYEGFTWVIIMKVST